MEKSNQCTQIPIKTCSLCNKSSAAEGISLVHFGEWMTKDEITAHYYCLLLSNHLPQRGKDEDGILGFLLSDIRHEITMAKNRKCMYCLEMSATIQCAKCEQYFHLTCGHTSKCLSQFVGQFNSYCHGCIPIDQCLVKLLSHKPPKAIELCIICTQPLATRLERGIYGKCCGRGFTHSKCMKIYALSAGYYLKCIWCKDKRFREDIKWLGIFVPDREANWEKEKLPYTNLYRRLLRCDIEICNCPKGRDYRNGSKWQLISCKLCGIFGAHNPCVPGFEDSKEKLLEFKCDVCSVTEKTVINRNILEPSQNLLDTSLDVIKDKTETEPKINHSQNETTNNHTLAAINSCKTHNVLEEVQLSSTVYTLTQSPQAVPEVGLPKMQKEECSDDDDHIVDILVQRLLDTIDDHVFKNT